MEQWAPRWGRRCVLVDDNQKAEICDVVDFFDQPDVTKVHGPKPIGRSRVVRVGEEVRVVAEQEVAEV